MYNINYKDTHCQKCLLQHFGSELWCITAEEPVLCSRKKKADKTEVSKDSSLRVSEVSMGQVVRTKYSRQASSGHSEA